MMENVKAIDVRIGNWVYGYKTIWHIDKEDFRMVDPDTQELPYQPIPLNKITAEQFKEMGFSYSHGVFFVFKDNAHVLSYSPIDGFFVYGHKVAIKYVHQLQNLYTDLLLEK